VAHVTPHGTIVTASVKVFETLVLVPVTTRGALPATTYAVSVASPARALAADPGERPVCLDDGVAVLIEVYVGRPEHTNQILVRSADIPRHGPPQHDESGRVRIGLAELGRRRGLRARHVPIGGDSSALPTSPRARSVR